MKSPAFQFYPSDYLASQRVQMMTLEEEGAYVRLLCYCWQHGSIPADPGLASRLIGKGCSTTLATVVLGMFNVDLGGGRLSHDRLEAERAKQAIWREKSAEGGRKSAEKRKGGSTTVARVVQPPNQPNGNSSVFCLQSSSPSSDSGLQTKNRETPPRIKFSRPTLEEVKARASSQGIPSQQAELFFSYYESNGWKVARNPMQNWHQALNAWVLRNGTPKKPESKQLQEHVEVRSLL